MTRTAAQILWMLVLIVTLPIWLAAGLTCSICAGTRDAD